MARESRAWRFRYEKIQLRQIRTDSQTRGPQDAGYSPWQRLKTKRISYLTLPLLIMATVTEFVILATGWEMPAGGLSNAARA